jgi:hypothetical protein
MHPLGFHNLDETTIVVYPPRKHTENEERAKKIQQKLLINKQIAK